MIVREQKDRQARSRAGRRIVQLVAATVSSLIVVLTAQAHEIATVQPLGPVSERVVDVRIAPQPLDSALTRLADQANLRIVFSSAAVAGIESAGLDGRFTIGDALTRLLAGTGFTFRFVGDDAVALERAREQTSESAVQLGPVRVVEGVTEGTGSYTTELTNTATRLTLPIQETPQSVSVITHQRIEDQGLEEIQEALSETVGLFFLQSGPLGSDNNFIYSRGFPLLNYQVDGTPRSTRFGFRNDIADLAIFDRVEVVRGASGLLNAVGEPSGTVNLVRKRPTTEFQANASAKYGSWSHYRVDGDIGGPITKTGSVRARLVGAYQDSGDFVDRLNLDKQILYGVVDADLGSSTAVSVGVEYQDHEIKGGNRSGTPIYFPDGTRTNFPRSANLAADWAYHTRRTLSFIGSAEHHFSNEWRLELDVEHSRREYADVMPEIFLSAEAITASPYRFGGTPRQSSIRLHAVGPYRLFGKTHELVGGVSYDAYRSKGLNYHAESRTIDYDDVLEIIRSGALDPLDVSPSGGGSLTYEWQSGAYAATRLHPAERVAILLGSRLSNWKTRRDRFDASDVVTRGTTSKETAVITPYVGLVVTPIDVLSLYASYTDIFQPATVYDANGDLLEPAVGSNVEGGAKLSFFKKRLNISGAWFKTNKDDVPEYVPGPGGSVNYGPTGQYVYEGVDGTTASGVEFEISGQVTPRWQVSGGYTYTNPRDVNGNRRLTYIPRDTLKFFTSHRLAGALKDLTLGGNLRWQSAIAYDAVGASLQYFRQTGFAIVDLMAQYEVTPHLAVTLNVDNVFDKRYFTDITFSGWYGTPRSASLTVRAGF